MHEADDAREHRAANEYVGEIHDVLGYSFGGVGLGRWSAPPCCSTTTALPLCSFIWPAVTISSPALTPLEHGDLVAARLAEFHERCCT
jgi:hypothetical protein